MLPAPFPFTVRIDELRSYDEWQKHLHLPVKAFNEQNLAFNNSIMHRQKL